MADKTIATGASSGEGSGLRDCRALKSERKALDNKFDGTIKPLILFWHRATVNGENCEFAATNPVSCWLERHYSERKVMPRHLEDPRKCGDRRASY